MKDGRLKRTAFIILAALLFIVGMAAVDVRAAVSDYDCSAQTAIPEDQCQALLAIYEATDGDSWTVKTNWLASDNPCDWHGVSCLEDTIIALDLYNNNLTGKLPLEIGAFPDLETLTVNNNPLTGPVPVTVTFMNLRLFHFHNTGLCEPSDPVFQDWLLGVVYRFSNGTYCSPPPPTATFQASGPTPGQPTSDLPWPQQTLTAMAELAATEQAVPDAPTLTPTPTKYYTLESPTPVPTDTPPPVLEDDQSPGDGQDSGLGGFLPDFLGGIPKTWLLLLLIPVGLIVVGLLLELRERRKEAEPFDDDSDVSDALFKLDYFDPNEDK